MALCNCHERPRCEFQSCSEGADWSFLWTFPRYQPKFMFACDWHMKKYLEFENTHIPGLDRPPYADEAWRPSLLEMIRIADMRIKHEDRKKKQTATQHHVKLSRQQRYTPQQMAALERLRQQIR